jgi:bifunctional non-homologous end joining protein LigD
VRPPALAPMLASNGSVPSGEGWAAEVKWDGFRIVATVSGGTLSLRSRPGSNATDWFPELAELPAGLTGHDAVLDGEVVICQNGRPAFHLLRRRFGGRSTDGPRATFMVFDLLWLDGEELYRLPWNNVGRDSRRSASTHRGGRSLATSEATTSATSTRQRRSSGLRASCSSAPTPPTSPVDGAQPG